jgi:hypothetical protein
LAKVFDVATFTNISATRILWSALRAVATGAGPAVYTGAGPAVYTGAGPGVYTGAGPAAVSTTGMVVSWLVALSVVSVNPSTDVTGAVAAVVLSASLLATADLSACFTHQTSTPTAARRSSSPMTIPVIAPPDAP